MAAPTFVNAGNGAVDATAPHLVADHTSVTVGNVVILHVLQDGSGTSPTLSISGGTGGVEDLAGTDGALTSIGEFTLGGSAQASQHLWIGRAISTSINSGLEITLTGGGGDDIYSRWYQFSGVNAGTTLAAVIENGSAGATVNSAGTSATIADASVQTLGSDRLACNFVAGNDDNALDAFTGMSGGTWAEAVAEYAVATGTDGVLGLQTATIASAGTIDGGTDGWADAADSWGVVGFALIPAGGSTVTFAVSVSGTGAVAPDFVRNQRVFAVSIAGTGALAAPLAVTRSIAASIAGSGAVTSPLAVTRSIAASIAGSGVVSPTLALVKLLNAAIAGSGVVVADFVRNTIGLSTGIAGSGSVSPSLVRSLALQAAVAGTGAVTSAVVLTKTLVAAIAGTGAVSAAITRTQSLATSIAGTASVAADLTVSGGAAVVRRVRTLFGVGQ